MESTENSKSLRTKAVIFPLFAKIRTNHYCVSLGIVVDFMNIISR